VVVFLYLLFSGIIQNERNRLFKKQDDYIAVNNECKNIELEQKDE